MKLGHHCCKRESGSGGRGSALDRYAYSGRTGVNVNIREAGVGELGKVLEIYEDAGIDTGFHLTADGANLIYKKMKSYPSYKIYLAETNGVPCGTFTLLIMDNIAHGGSPAGIVAAVAVNRCSQGKGVGKAMMRFAMDQCKLLDATR